jgi:uncharacterized protein
MSYPSRKKIAVIGTGISGLGAAWLLDPHHDVTVYEKNDYVGGHSRTVEVKTENGTLPVDTGFIVFNKRNYPHLTRLFEHLEVPVSQSDMSFGVSINGGWLEYGTQKPSHMLAQKINLLRPAFWGMIMDMIKFNKKALTYLSKDPSFTLGECLEELKVGPWFQQYYLLAMGASIWSAPLSQILKFPACTFVRFFENHGLLTLTDHPQWYTVVGGSQEYVKRISAPFKERIHLKCGVKKIWRSKDGVFVEDIYGQIQSFDEVVLACHAPQSLSMIDDASAQEKEALKAFRTQPNRAVLHSDIRFMPRRRKAWASWVYLSQDKNDANAHVSLSYWMNNLQPLQTDAPLIVTLNPGHEPDPKLVYDDHIFEHPVFDEAALQSQQRIAQLQGQNRLWFCGAYQRYGFHEDGFNSALQVAQGMGIEPPWQ